MVRSCVMGGTSSAEAAQSLSLLFRTEGRRIGRHGLAFAAARASSVMIERSSRASSPYGASIASPSPSSSTPLCVASAKTDAR